MKWFGRAEDVEPLASGAVGDADSLDRRVLHLRDRNVDSLAQIEHRAFMESVIETRGRALQAGGKNPADGD